MNWLKYKKFYYLLSLTFIVVSAFSIVKFGFTKGVDFVGGTSIEYLFDNEFSTEQASDILRNQGIETTSIQRVADRTYIFKFGVLDQAQKEQIETTLEKGLGFGVTEQRYELVGPSISRDLIVKTALAIGLSTLLILFWITLQFKNILFGAAAILAMIHDSFILLGTFSLLGHFLQVEVDYLFVTALLTTLSFSVHDTIVVFDRIREIQRKDPGNLEDISNKALTETFVRSLNNSFTIIFMLVALILLGGSTVKWFATALLVGTIFGTYSSPFVAVPLLNSFHLLKRK